MLRPLVVWCVTADSNSDKMWFAIGFIVGAAAVGVIRWFRKK